MQDAQWLSTEDVARLLGMSPSWVRRQIVAGRLKAVAYKVGKRPTYRVARSALNAFLRDHRYDPSRGSWG